MTNADRERNIQPAAADLFRDRRKTRLIGSLLLFLTILAVYNPISRAPFLNYDDDYYILQNSHVRAGLTLKTVEWAIGSTDLSNWHPLTWISHALDVQLFGLNPAGHHYVNVLFHALNAVLLFLLLQQSTGFAWRSLAVAVLFGIHPINVESVAWISERKNVLSMTFFLLGLIAYVRYATRPSVRRYASVALCFALGLAAKPQVITFPFVLLLMDYWPLRRAKFSRESSDSTIPPTQPRDVSRLVLEKVPLMLFSVASAFITMKAQATATHIELPFSVRLANGALAYLSYIGKLLWPVHLAPLYPHPGLSVNSIHAMVAAIALATITLAVLATRRPYFATGWLWFLGTLVPMVGLVQVGVQAMADRYAYIPSIGVFIVVCWGVAELFEVVPVPRWVLAFAGVAVVVALALVSRRQISYWNENVTLWTHTIEVTHNNFVAEDSLALALISQARQEEAIPHFQKAIQINPNDPIANLNLAIYEQQRGHYETAIAGYKANLRLTTNPQLLTIALARLGSAFHALKDYDAARNSYEAALRESPENAQALLGLGLLDQRAGADAQAADEYSRSIQYQPTDVGFLLLALVLENSGQRNAAEAARAEAKRISPDLDRAQHVAAQLESE